MQPTVQLNMTGDGRYLWGMLELSGKIWITFDAGADKCMRFRVIPWYYSDSFLSLPDRLNSDNWIKYYTKQESQLWLGSRTSDQNALPVKETSMHSF